MFYAAVLAGGKSSRMGQDKAGLVLGGKTLLERAVSLLQHAGAELVLIGGAPGHNSVPDLMPHCGPPGGLYSLLDHIKHNYCLDGSPLLLIPVDMPLLTVATLQHLLTASVNASCCHYEDEVFPCIVKATPDLYTHLRDLFHEGTELGGRRSMKGIFSYLGAKAVPADDVAPGEFRNVNTPEDWHAIRNVETAGEKKGR